MDIPAPLRTSVEQGNVVLMLGSGASMASKSDAGASPPSAGGLASLLADRFLNANYRSHPLSQVADFAISESSLFEVQSFIREIFLPFRPSAAHLLLPTFRWRAIFTTNYDVLTEDAFSAVPNRAQELVPLFKNVNRWDGILSDSDKVALFKLHGCIHDTHDIHCPLILSTENYIDFRTGRDRLFRQFQELAAERTFLFVGYSLNDPNIRSLLRDLDREQVGRPRSYMVSNSVDEISSRYWSSRLITTIQGTFQDLMAELDRSTGIFRAHRKSTPAGVTAIAERFAVAGYELAPATLKSMELDIEYVKSITTDSACDPRRFYAGVSQDWAPIQHDFDVRRKLTDRLIEEYFLEDAKKHRFVLLKAHAGSGKSVFLRRLAWEASNEYNRLCFFCRSDAELHSSAFMDLLSACKEHIFLFCDDVVGMRHQLETLLRNLGTTVSHLTIIGGARTNEWNGAPPSFRSLITTEHTLGYLSDDELQLLIALLEKHDALNAMAKLSPQYRREALMEKAGRQLLVALHEATSGRPFEEILHNEFDRLTPTKAKAIYLMICLLNQFNVPVRAGLISRRFGVTFEEFQKQFFQPLEDVVIVPKRKAAEDFCYSARHPHVAEVVVRNELSNTDDLFNEYVSVFNELNIAYTADEQAFRRMTQAHELKALFPDAQQVFALFAKATEVAGSDDAFLLQQQALYEMKRHSGNLNAATGFLERACEVRPNNTSLKHSCAELYIRRSEDARTSLEKRNLLDKAKNICIQLRREAKDSYPVGTIVKAGINWLEHMHPNDDLLQSEDVEGLIKNIEKDLKNGLQEFPGDSFLLAQEARLAKLLSEDTRLVTALRKSFAGNHRNSGVALQLATSFENAGNLADAQQTLKAAIDANRGHQRLHFAFAVLLEKHGLGRPDEILYHYKHSFHPGDNNRDAQLRYGRQLFLAGEYEASKEVFQSLRSVRLPNDIKQRLVYPLDGEFTGRVSRIEAWYCLICRNGDGAIVSLQADSIGDKVNWRDLHRHQELIFRIAFSMYGPQALDVHAITN